MSLRASPRPSPYTYGAMHYGDRRYNESVFLVNIMNLFFFGKYNESVRVALSYIFLFNLRIILPRALTVCPHKWRSAGLA